MGNAKYWQQRNSGGLTVGKEAENHFKRLVPNWCGEKMDNDLAVLGLLQLE